MVSIEVVTNSDCLSAIHSGFTAIMENLEIRGLSGNLNLLNGCFFEKIEELSGNLNSNQGNHGNLEPCQVWIFLL